MRVIGRPERPRFREVLHFLLRFPEVLKDRAYLGLDRFVETSSPWRFGTPEEAWEALANEGMIPASWVGDPYRTFNGSTTPPTIGLCALVASSVQGVLLVEEAAREFAHRMAPWDAPEPSRMAWRLCARDKADPRWRREAVSTWMDKYKEAYSSRAEGRDDVEPFDPWSTLPEDTDWMIVTRSIEKYRDRYHRRLFDSPSPWEPSLAVWDLGYMLLDMGADGDFALLMPWEGPKVDPRVEFEDVRSAGSALLCTMEKYVDFLVYGPLECMLERSLHRPSLARARPPSLPRVVPRRRLQNHVRR